MIEKIILTLIVIVLGLILVHLASIPIFKFIKKKMQTPIAPPPLPEVEIVEVVETKMIPETLKNSAIMCSVHPQNPSENECLICYQPLCQTCVKTFKTLHFCTEHLAYFLKINWSEVGKVKTHPEKPEEGVELLAWKKQVWDEYQIPLYHESQYAINVDQDRVDTTLILYCPEDLKEKVMELRGQTGPSP
jgi:hypothetical protein